MHNHPQFASSGMRLPNEAWEALFRAQVALVREFAAGDLWKECSMSEYDVLYTLRRFPEGATMTEINRIVLMTQGGLSKLVARLVERGLVERCVDEHDRRAVNLRLSEEGRQMQVKLGRLHAAQVARAMRERLTDDELEQLRELTLKLQEEARQ